MGESSNRLRKTNHCSPAFNERAILPLWQVFLKAGEQKNQRIGDFVPIGETNLNGTCIDEVSEF